MNERIQKIAEQAGLKVNADGEISPAFFGSVDEGYRKFAELIVRECADIARAHTLEKYPGMKSDYDGIVHVEEAIKQHFGVEE
jgi:hypothetical protein